MSNLTFQVSQQGFKYPYSNDRFTYPAANSGLSAIDPIADVERFLPALQKPTLVEILEMTLPSCPLKFGAVRS